MFIDIRRAPALVRLVFRGGDTARIACACALYQAPAFSPTDCVSTSRRPYVCMRVYVHTPLPPPSTATRRPFHPLCLSLAPFSCRWSAHFGCTGAAGGGAFEAGKAQGGNFVVRGVGPISPPPLSPFPLSLRGNGEGGGGGARGFCICGREATFWGFVGLWGRFLS